MTPRMVRRGLGLALSMVCLASVTGGLPGADAAAPKTIHPGVSVNYGDVTCTVGAVLRAGHRVFLAAPASCGGIDLGKANTDGCAAPQTPLGSPVSIQGAKHRGTLVYSSFSEMQLRGDQNPRRCYYNDLTLIRVDRRDRARVSAAIPGVGVPRRVVSKLPAKGAHLLVDGAATTAGATHQRAWELDMSSPTAMWKTPDCGSAVTLGHKLVGMLLVLPKGPVPGAPVDQEAAETFNLFRALKYLRTTPHFHHVHLPVG
ncbi:MAG TPA: hypothetical protein VHE56_08415 [Mycobacteriales bacterium]|nr:hypothetical protein [Mycobacteriales bacterium]